MSIPFRVGRYIDASGFALAVVDIPELDPDKNISLIDRSHRWEENVASSDRSVIKSEVDNGGHMPAMTVTEFVVTNISTTATNDVVEAPLYYRHRCRFYNFTYGQSPGKQVYITDQNENILKNVNYAVIAERVAANVYEISVLTDFYNDEFSQYKVKYNRCNSLGQDIYPGWVETINSSPYFTKGSPFYNTTEYDISGPDRNGMWSVIVPPVPTLSNIVNSVGVSFENCPTIVNQDVTNDVAEYSAGVVVKYTLKATSATTFTVSRDKDRYGNSSSAAPYLQSATNDSWGAGQVQFTIGTDITAIYGTILHVHGDNNLRSGDEAYFTAKRSYYYLMPIAYSAMYLKKPTNVTPEDDWYIQVHNGRFRRCMDTQGRVVPSGYGTTFEYGIPERGSQFWDSTFGPPYVKAYSERAELLDKNTIQLQHTPLYVDASSVMHNPLYPGFLPSGYIKVSIDHVDVPATGILDWDLYNGTVKLAQTLSHRQDIIAEYVYESQFYEYKGYTTSDTEVLCLFDASGVQDFYNAEVGGRVTFYGNAETDTTQKYSGYASLKLDGTSYVTLPSSNNLNFGEKDFTIESRVKFNCFSSNFPTIIAKCYDNGQTGWELVYFVATGKLSFIYSTDGTWASSVVIDEDWLPSFDVWYTVVVERSGSNIRFLIDGNQHGSDHNIGTDSFFSNSQPISIGCDLDSTESPWGVGWLNGWVDDIKITRDRAVYLPGSGSYTVSPSGDLPSSEVSVNSFVKLDLNPTPDHSYGMYASGVIAYIFAEPYINVDLFTTIKYTTLYHNFTGTPNSPYDFELGSISLGPHCKIEDIQITDVRNRGGGLSKLGIANIDKVLEVQPEAEFFWDVGYFDGQAVPSNGTLVVRIPKTVLTSNGGQFTEDDVRQKVLKHMALGEYPILEFV
jgi:hypothetical protein